jgi:hypothetical protein
MSTSPTESPLPTDPSSTPSKPKQRRLWWILTAIFGLGFLSLLVCCGGIFYLSGEFLGLPFVDQLNRMPAVTQRVGQVQKVSVDIPGTLATFEKYPNHLVIEAHGADGSTSLLVEQGEEANILTAYFYDPDGNHELINTKD